MNNTLSASQISTLFKSGDTIATGYINKTLWISNGQASYALIGWPKMTAMQLITILGKKPDKHKIADWPGIIDSIMLQKPRTTKLQSPHWPSDGGALRMFICHDGKLFVKDQYLSRLPDNAELFSFNLDGKRGIIANVQSVGIVAVIMQYKGDAMQSIVDELVAFSKVPMLGEGHD